MLSNTQRLLQKTLLLFGIAPITKEVVSSSKGYDILYRIAWKILLGDKGVSIFPATEGITIGNIATSKVKKA